MKKTWIFIAVAIVVVIGSYSLAKPKSDIGKQVVSLELNDLDGNVVNLADFKGEKIYLHYWASWCSICLAELEETDALAGEDLDFKVLTVVAPGSKGEMSTEEFKTWFAGLGTKNMKVLLDEGGKYASDFGIRGFPTSIYIDSEGNYVKTVSGAQSNDAVKEEFKAIQ